MLYTPHTPFLPLSFPPSHSLLFSLPLPFLFSPSSFKVLTSLQRTTPHPHPVSRQFPPQLSSTSGQQHISFCLSGQAYSGGVSWIFSWGVTFMPKYSAPKGNAGKECLSAALIIQYFPVQTSCFLSLKHRHLQTRTDQLREE